MFEVGSCYRNFVVKRSTPIDELQATLIELEHRIVGTEVIAIQAQDSENFFAISFQTPPPSSNGVTHIIEHTVLAGSKKYPVKDPFFSMQRRSLNTFMNALTGADMTCYVAATQNKKDFYNLLSVFSDAIFNPLLRKESFSQEGWRLEFSSPQDSTSPLQYKGVVYNEMKGAMASPMRRLWEHTFEMLFPGSPYGFNSGGAPSAIPTLSYEQFLDYWHSHYSVGRALFFFYGDLPLKEHLDYLEDFSLKNGKKERPKPVIGPQKRFLKPVRKEFFYPTSHEDKEPQSFMSLAFLTSSIHNRLESLALTVLDLILMENDASLLRKPLMASGLCRGVSSSLDTENPDLPNTLVFKGIEPQAAEKLEKLFFTTLAKIVKDTIPQEQILSALRQLELERLEIGQDGVPFGLSLFGRIAALKQHGGKIEDGLTIYSLFSELEELLKEKPRFLEELIEKYFLLNPHFVRVVLQPDADLEKKEAQTERAILDAIAAESTAKQKKQICKESAILATLQEENPESLNVLPKILLKDIPPYGQSIHLLKEQVANLSCFFHPVFTNHVLYADLVLPLGAIQKKDLGLARLFCHLVGQVGSGGRTWSENLQYIQDHTGGISCGFSLNNQVKDSLTFAPSLHLKGKALSRKKEKLFSLFFDTIESIDFSDSARIKDCIFKLYAGMQSAIPSQALSWAVSQSSASLGEIFWLSEEWSGLSFFHMVRSLVNNWNKKEKSLIEGLERLKEALFQFSDPHLVISGDMTSYTELKVDGFCGLADCAIQNHTPWKNHSTPTSKANTAWQMSSPVAFTAKAFHALSYGHPDSAALLVTANLFSNKVLHKKIREQGGAYGGGASYNPTSGLFYFYSYRDPHLLSTAQSFQEAVAQVGQGKFSATDLEEAKLEIFASLDSPIPPGNRADVAYRRYREGKTDDIRDSFRQKVLQVSQDHVQKVCTACVTPIFNGANLVTFCGKELIEKEKEALQLTVKKV